MVAREHLEHQQRKPRWLHFVIFLVIVLLSVLMMFLSSRFSSHLFPVRQVLLEGKFQHSNPEQLQTVLNFAAESGLLTVDLLQLQSDLQEFPWINAVDIERVWPDSLRVLVTEKNPYLRLGNDKIVSVEGVVFSPESSNKFSNLPLLNINQSFTPELFEAYREIEYLLAQNGYELKQFNIDKQGEWSLELTDSISIAIGRTSPLSIFKRFIGILPNLGKDPAKKLNTIDLRYENGFAIGYAE